MKLNKRPEGIKAKYSKIFENRTYDQKIKLKEYLLMSKFLSEIEKKQEENKISRKNLAQLINTSASYLTQVFRGDKPLNFRTLAKIEDRLNIGFDIRVYDKYQVFDDAYPNKISIPEFNNPINSGKKYSSTKFSAKESPLIINVNSVN